MKLRTLTDYTPYDLFKLDGLDKSMFNKILNPKNKQGILFQVTRKFGITKLSKKLTLEEIEMLVIGYVFTYKANDYRRIHTVTLNKSCKAVKELEQKYGALTKENLKHYFSISQIGSCFFVDRKEKNIEEDIVRGALQQTLFEEHPKKDILKFSLPVPHLRITKKIRRTRDVAIIYVVQKQKEVKKVKTKVQPVIQKTMTLSVDTPYKVNINPENCKAIKSAYLFANLINYFSEFKKNCALATIMTFREVVNFNCKIISEMGLGKYAYSSTTTSVRGLLGTMALGFNLDYYDYLKDKYNYNKDSTNDTLPIDMWKDIIEEMKRSFMSKGYIIPLRRMAA